MHIARIATLGLSLIFSPLAQAAAQTQMIESGGHEIAFHVTPGHLPAIVLDAGGGLDSSYWKSLVPELAKRTGSMIVTYDRAGFGASDEVKGPWNVQSATDDLENGLIKLGATHDVILVSHSLAGEIALYLANRHPDWFAGAVLVDANVPELFTDEMINAQVAAYAQMVAAAKAAPPSKERRQLLSLSASFVETSKAFHKAEWPKTVPAIVIVSEKTPFEGQEQVAQFWRMTHADFAKKAGNRTLVTAEKSSHDIAHDRPDVILQAVDDIAAHAR